MPANPRVGTCGVELMPGRPDSACTGNTYRCLICQAVYCVRSHAGNGRCAHV